MNDPIAMAIEGSDGVNQPALGLGCCSLRVTDVMNRVACGIELHPLKTTGKETRPPLARGDGLRIAPTDAGHDDKARQIF